MRHNINGVVGELTSLPGCSQVVVSHSVFCPKYQRGQRKGMVAHGARLSLMREFGYDAAICTVDMSNAAQLKILHTHGWEKVFEFESSKTGHKVGLFVKEL